MTVGMERFCQDLCGYIVNNSERASRFLYPDPQHYLFTEPLVEFIVEASGYSKTTIAEWINAAAEKREGDDGTAEQI